MIGATGIAWVQIVVSDGLGQQTGRLTITGHWFVMQLPDTPRADLARSNVVSRVSVILFDFLAQIARAGYAGLVTGLALVAREGCSSGNIKARGDQLKLDTVLNR